MDKKNVLLIATEYPPAGSSSGVQRILKFSQYLPLMGWDVSVLSMHPMAYGKDARFEQIAEIPKSVNVKRALAFNSSIHFAIKGRYLRYMALPDRWVSWVFFGFFSSLRMIRKKRPDVLFSSYPHASAHLLALLLHRVTSIPWVADFRDPMLYRNDHLDVLQAKAFNWIERKTMKYCQYAIFTTPGAIEGYAKRHYSDCAKDKWHLIPNGYAEDNFVLAEQRCVEEANIRQQNEMEQPRCLVLVHAGVLYRAERDPTSFFKAVALLLKQGDIVEGQVKIILRAPSSEDYYQNLIAENALEKVLFIEQKISYQQTLVEMLTVDGLLLFQGSMCNHQIPAKLYEYFRAKKPIFSLTDPEGDTAALLCSANVNSMAPLDDVKEIAMQFRIFLKQLRAGAAPVVSDAFVVAQSRQARTKQLAAVLDSCVGH